MKPSEISTPEQLAQAIAMLRRAAAPPGKAQLTVRELADAACTHPSTLHPYLTGRRLFPQDIYLRILARLGETGEPEVKDWLAAWERVGDLRHARKVQRRAGRFTVTDGATVTHYRVNAAMQDTTRRIGIAAGRLRQFRFADVWVNPENTKMKMPRIEEFSISAIIRYHGSVRDGEGEIVEDLIRDELRSKMEGRRSVPPGTAIVTGAGELNKSHGVRFIVHVAAVHGQAGAGYRPVDDIGECVSNALRAAETLGGDEPVRDVIVPLLGTGVGGGELVPTVHTILVAAIDHLSSTANQHLHGVHLLASTPEELAVCRAACDTTPRLTLISPQAARS